MDIFRVVLPVVFIGACVLHSLQATPVPEECYSTKYDNIDYLSILRSKRLLNNYVKCLLDEGPCPTEGQLLKEQLPDAISTRCIKCSMKQKKGALDVIEIMQKDHKDAWEVLQKRWDPNGDLTEPALEALRKETAGA